MEITISKVLALVVVLVYAIALVMSGGEKELPVILVLLLPLGMIWFPDEIGDYVGPAGHGTVDRPSPGCLIAAIGWFFLVGIQELGLKQKDLAARLGVAKETISRWLNGSMLQTRAMDNLLRAYFALPQLRAALTGTGQDPNFGASVLTH